MDVKAQFSQLVPLCTFTTGAGQIVVDDPVQRVIHFNVPETLIVPPLVPGKYFYDVIMFDGSTPPIRIPLMHGDFIVTDGVTGG
jgi:energy-converting hydrogenase Eha subunit C